MSRVSRGSAGGEAYLELRRLARRTGRPTDELLHLYVLEGFLARLARSPLQGSFVLKGGVLLAAFDSRRPTRDVDLAGRDLGNDPDTVLGLVRDVLTVEPTEDDGVEFLPGSTAEVIREEDDYNGIRVSASARLATANVRFHVDINVGDPIWPAPDLVGVPRLRGGEPIRLTGYPLHMVHAEKIVTAIQRGTANTRWRDFADVRTLARRQAVDGVDLRRALEAVAGHRRVELATLRETLDGYPGLAQPRWTAWRRRNAFDHLPDRFEDVLGEVMAFGDPVIVGEVDGRSWDPDVGEWT